MAYVHKLITTDEKMVGVARLHWIYVLKGISWFLGLTAAGWLVHSLIMRGLSFVADGIDSNSLTYALSPLLNFIIFIPMMIGFVIFVLNVIKVLSTEIGLTNRRVIKKTGWLFVKVNHIDLEEVRGENMDTGMFGRFLGYAYINLDCRFIGDVKIDAIEKPNLFMRHLHKERAETQDALKILTGKSGTQHPVELYQGPAGEKPDPEIVPPQPKQPEISPPTPQPEVPEPPAPPQIDPPAPTQPPTKDAAEALPRLDPPPLEEARRYEAAPTGQQPAQPVDNKPEEKSAQPAQPQPIDPQTVAQVVQQVMPQMAQEVVKQMAEQGLIHPEEEKPEDDIDIALIHSFDEARIKGEGKGNDLHNTLEHAIN